MSFKDVRVRYARPGARKADQSGGAAMNPATFLRRRASGGYSVDPWGLDADLIELVTPVAGWRWAVDVEGAGLIPTTGAALLVFNRRFGLSEPAVVVTGVRQATGRAVRIVGMPDVAPVGPLLRRLGAAVDTAAEVASLLRAGEVVAAPLGIELGFGRRAGRFATRIVAAALALDVPVFPVATVGHEIGRHWRVVIGTAVTIYGGLPSPAEAVDTTRASVQALLDAAPPPGRFRR
jgi:hypothetical protein